MAYPLRDSRTKDEQERDELHRLLIYLRGVEHSSLPVTDKTALTESHYARVVWLNTPVRDRA